MASAVDTKKDIEKLRAVLQTTPDLLCKNEVSKVWKKLEDCAKKKGEQVEHLFNTLETSIHKEYKTVDLKKRKEYTNLKTSIIQACNKKKGMGVHGTIINVTKPSKETAESNEITETAFERLYKLLRWLKDAVDGSLDVQMPAFQNEHGFTPEFNLKCQDVEGYVDHIWKTYREKVRIALKNPTGIPKTTKDQSQEIDFLRREKKELGDQIQDLNHKLQGFEGEKQHLIARNQELSQQNKETKHQQTKQPSGQHSQDAKAMSDKIKDLENTVQTLRRKLQELEEEKKAGEMRNQQLNQQNNVNTHPQSRNPSGQHSQDAKAMSDKIKELEETVQTLRRKLQELEEKKKAGGMRNQQLNQQNNVNAHPQNRKPSAPHSQDAKAMPDKHKELEETVQTLRRRLQELEEEKKAGGMRHNEDQQGKFTELQEKVRDLKKQIQTLEDEKQHWITRASKMAGDKLKENNPGITDLSDPNRPQKLAEQYGELYDNEWTDAMVTLNPKEDSKQERKCIDTLSSILKDCYEACETKADKHMQDLENTCMMKGGKDQKIPSKAHKCPQESKTNLQQAQKQTSMLTLETVTKIICAELSKKISESKKVVQYVEKCVGVCWAMVVHQPRPCFAWPDSNEKQIRLDMFKHYTKSGDTLDFVVWPAMQLHVSGPLLRKGTVQPK